MAQKHKPDDQVTIHHPKSNQEGSTTYGAFLKAHEPNGWRLGNLSKPKQEERAKAVEKAEVPAETP